MVDGPKVSIKYEFQWVGSSHHISGQICD